MVCDAGEADIVTSSDVRAAGVVRIIGYLLQDTSKI